MTAFRYIRIPHGEPPWAYAAEIHVGLKASQIKSQEKPGAADKAEHRRDLTMISPVSSTQTNVIDQHVQSKPAQRPAPQPASDPQDTVHLSAAAQKAGDVDHDGDSH
jgi:hypothetical protein